MTNSQKRISVAVIIDNSNNILIDQRPPHDSMGGYCDLKEVMSQTSLT